MSATTAEARLQFTGRLDAPAVARAWQDRMREAAGAHLVLEVGELTGLDTAGAVFLLQLEAAAAETRWEGLADGPVRATLERTRAALAGARPEGMPAQDLLEEIGAAAIGRGEAVLQRVAFLGETLVAGSATVARPRRLRASELLRHLDEAGLQAFGLCALLGFLIGLILAFQSSIPMRQFGAELYIPNLVGLSLLRELGPLMAAVVLAGRTGSAYAAELGTMVVNEEVDALRIMGIDPIAWLVLPRLLAAMLVMPVLALLMDLCGLIGMGVVMGTLGFPPVAVVNQLQRAVTVSDLLGGEFKAAVFGAVIGIIGCRAGLGAARGPRAVGDAATAAVVGGIVAVVILDGIFAVVFFRLNL